MALAIDLTEECGLSNEVCRELLLKNSKVMLYLPFISLFNQLYFTNKTGRFSFISGRAVQVLKLIKEE